MAEPGKSSRESGNQTDADGASHILAELVSAEALTSPIKASGRIKYTCIGVSKHYIGLGASSGSLYIFHRNSFKYLQVYSNTEGALTKVVFAPDDNVVGIATSQGVIIAWELNIERRERSTRLAVSSAHRNGHVTSMIWDPASERLFSGDGHGRITFLNVYHRKMAGLFKLPTELVMDADSPIVQLDFSEDKLLASTTTKCYICDTKKKQSYAVGTKPREGQFGACFLHRTSKEFPLIYSARPGSRMWEVNIVGQVQATHQFKHLLTVPSLPVVGLGRSPVFPEPDHVQKPQSLNFAQLLTFGHGHNLLMTWSTNAIYVFDPARIKVVMWTMDCQDIIWACVYKARVYCLHPNSLVRCYSLLSAERCISKLFALSQWEQCAKTAVYFAERVKQGDARRYVPRSLIQEVNYQLMDGNADVGLMRSMEELLSNMEEDGLSTPGSSRRSSLDSCEGVRLDSGIYLVRNRAGSDDSVEDFPVDTFKFTSVASAIASVDQETQMDRETEVKLSYHRDADSQDGQVASVSSDEVIQESSDGTKQQVTQGTTGVDSSEIPAEDVEMSAPPAATDEMETFEEEVECPGKEMCSPAGINWDFSHGGSALQQETSLLDEIAERTDMDQVDALAKEEQDIGVVGSLNSTVESPMTDTHKEPQSDDPGDDKTTEVLECDRAVLDDCHGNPRESSSDVEVDCSAVKSCDASEGDAAPRHPADSPGQTNDTTTSTFSSTSPSPAPTSSPSPSPSPSSKNHEEEALRGDQHEAVSILSTEATFVTAQDHSQLGSEIPNREFSSLKCPDSPQSPSSKAGYKSRPDHLPIVSQEASETRIININNNDIVDGDEPIGIVDDEPDWPAIHRSMSVPSVGLTGSDADSKKARKHSYSARDKKRSKKSRIIEFDKPKVSPRVKPSGNDPTVTATSPSAESHHQQSKNPPPSTPTKRSQSVPSLPVTPAPTSIPSKSPSSIEAPPEMDQSARLASEGLMGCGPSDANFNPAGDMLFIGSPMLLAMSGSRIAAQFLAPSFSAMKESLSSKLVKTKSFLRQMSEQDVGSIVEEAPAMTSTQMDEMPEEKSLPSPSLEPAISPQPYSPSESSPSPVELTHPSTSHPPVSPLKAVPLEVAPTTRKVPIYEADSKAEYCSQLADDDDDGDGVLKKIAVATWEAKHSLQDPRVSLNPKGCHDIVEKWLGEIQLALATKHQPTRTESEEEMRHKEQMNQMTESQTRGTADLDGVDIPLMDQKIDFGDRESPSRDSPKLPDICIERKEPAALTPRSSDFDALRKRDIHDCGRSRCQSVPQVSDPFGLPAVILEDLSHLAMVCFEMGVFRSERAPAYSAAQSDPLSDNEQSGSFQDGESSSPETDQSCPALEADILNRHPAVSVKSSPICRSHNQSNCLCVDTQQQNTTVKDDVWKSEQDERAACFVRSMFFLLDVQRLRSILKSREGWRTQTMAAILNCLEAAEDVSESVDVRKGLSQAVKMGADNVISNSILHIHRLIQLGLADRAMEVMLRSFSDHLCPWEVMHLTQADTVPSHFFLDYVLALLDSVELIDRDTMLASICSDQEVKCHLLTSALSHGAPAATELFCSCGNSPRPGSHMTEWQYGTLADQMISLPAPNKDRLFALCMKHGYWSGCLKLCPELQLKQETLKIALQLTDLNVIMKEGILPMNVDEWILLLNLMSRSYPDPRTIQCLACCAILLTKQDDHWLRALATSTSLSNEACDWSLEVDTSSKPECDWIISGDGAAQQDECNVPSDWSPSVTWESISILLVESVGPGLASKMLQDTCIPCGELPRDFFKNCIYTSIIEKCERTMCLSMLETLDTYLWSKRNNTLSPHLHHAVLQEQSVQMSYQDFHPDMSISKMSSKNSTSLDSSSSFEDYDCHWGTNVLLNSDCEVCGLALSSTVSSRTSGLLAFRCGHVFHSACVAEKACVLCYEINCHKAYSDNRYM